MAMSGAVSFTRGQHKIVYETAKLQLLEQCENNPSHIETLADFYLGSMHTLQRIELIEGDVERLLGFDPKTGRKTDVL